MNKVSTQTTASLQGANVMAFGPIAVAADHAARIRSDVVAPVTAIGASFEKRGGVGVAVSIARNDVRTDTDATVNASSLTSRGVADPQADGIAVTARDRAAIGAVSGRRPWRWLRASTRALPVPVAAPWRSTSSSGTSGRRSQARPSRPRLGGDHRDHRGEDPRHGGGAGGVGRPERLGVVGRDRPGRRRGAQPHRLDHVWRAGGTRRGGVRCRQRAHCRHGGLARGERTETIAAVIEALALAVAASSENAVGVGIAGLFVENKIARPHRGDRHPHRGRFGASAAVTARHAATITANALAASVAVSLAGGKGGAVAVGLAVAHSTILADVLASIVEPGTIRAPGGIRVEATDACTILAQAIGIGISVAFAGARPR